MLARVKFNWLPKGKLSQATPWSTIWLMSQALFVVNMVVNYREEEIKLPNNYGMLDFVGCKI